MRGSVRKWHNDVLQYYQALMYESLVYPFNITTDSVKSFTFEDHEGMETQPMRGYLAMKEQDGRKVKYFIEEDFYEHMPLRVEKVDELHMKESSTRKSIIFRPLNPIPFKILPEKCFDNTREFVDSFVDFEHSKPDQWTIAKLVAIMGYVGKTFIGLCSVSEFGKSSVFEILHSITGKSPVFQPRSVPGVLIQITGEGNMVFDEVHQSSTEVKRCMENFTLQVAGNKPVYLNGAMRSKNTKAKYDVSGQSITYLYNVATNYRKPDDEFFDHIFSNNKAIDSRLLKLKLEGKLLEKFDRDFDMMKEAESNKMYYMKIAKHLLYLKQLKSTHGFKRQFTNNGNLTLKGRKKLIFDELTWLLDQYCNDQEEYDRFISLLEMAITGYRHMLFGEPQETLQVTEEVVK